MAREQVGSNDNGPIAAAAVRRERGRVSGMVESGEQPDEPELSQTQRLSGRRASDKLKWRWLSPAESFRAYRAGARDVEALRLGHGLLSQVQFAQALVDSAVEILMVSHGVILVGWGECEQGRTLNILTVHGNLADIDISYEELEAAAYERGADVIMSVGRPGYAASAERNGYEVTHTILMRKSLNGYSLS